MSITALLYHDVLNGERPDETGIPGAGAALYKMNLEKFRQHLNALMRAGVWPTIDPRGHIEAGRPPLVLTFDDGGASAHGCIAQALEEKGWRAHFFVTAGFIGRPGFLSADQIRELHERGHVIGSHSFSHPPRMLALDDEELLFEWNESIRVLAEIIRKPITCASVPGGMYSSRVAEAAATAGIRLLFTSEPTTSVKRISDCVIAGRYTLWGSSAAEESAGLATGNGGFRVRQSLRWRSRALAKRAGGRYYIGFRRFLLTHLRGRTA